MWQIKNSSTPHSLWNWPMADLTMNKYLIQLQTLTLISNHDKNDITSCKWSDKVSAAQFNWDSITLWILTPSSNSPENQATQRHTEEYHKDQLSAFIGATPPQEHGTHQRESWPQYLWLKNVTQNKSHVRKS